MFKDVHHYILVRLHAYGNRTRGKSMRHIKKNIHSSTIARLELNSFEKLSYSIMLVNFLENAVIKPHQRKKKVFF